MATLLIAAGANILPMLSSQDQFRKLPDTAVCFRLGLAGLVDV
jgi:hypothetical protein